MNTWAGYTPRSQYKEIMKATEHVAAKPVAPVAPAPKPASKSVADYLDTIDEQSLTSSQQEAVDGLREALKIPAKKEERSK